MQSEGRNLLQQGLPLPQLLKMPWRQVSLPSLHKIRSLTQKLILMANISLYIIIPQRLPSITYYYVIEAITNRVYKPQRIHAQLAE